MRLFILEALRHPGSENAFQNTTASASSRIYGKPLMPLLCGDNPLDNQVPSKFLTLTRTQLFLLRQWAVGKFINEDNEGLTASRRRPRRPGRATGSAGVLGTYSRRFVLSQGRDWLDRPETRLSIASRIKSNADPEVTYRPPGRAGKWGSSLFSPPPWACRMITRPRPATRRPHEAQRAAVAGRFQRVFHPADRCDL